MMGGLLRRSVPLVACRASSRPLGHDAGRASAREELDLLGSR
jgi:hypothetical protein